LATGPASTVPAPTAAVCHFWLEPFTQSKRLIENLFSTGGLLRPLLSAVATFEETN
jgi:hypothetical protein